MPRPQGMKAFTIVWFGQILSLVGSSMTGFALTIWAWKLTGSATALALVGIFSFVPGIIFGPITGALVDRWNRKLTMMLSDIATGLTTLIILILYTTGNLEIWHLYITGAFAGIFQSFQWPAYSAAISLMIPKEQYTRASGMMSLAEWGSGILAPILASALIGLIGVNGIMMIDLTTLSIAIITLFIVAIPKQTRTLNANEPKTSLWQDSLFGFKYIFTRPSMLGLQMVFFFGNLMASIYYTLNNPTILASTNNNTLILGTVQSVAAAGGILGSLFITAWGGPKRKVHGVFMGWVLSGLLGAVLFGFGVRWVWMWYIACFFGSFWGPVINSSNQAIWQSKVAPEIQGRVFSIRRIIAQVTSPLGALLAGQLADRVFEPAMKVTGSGLSELFGGIFLTQPGSGMSTLITLSGILTIGVGLAAYAFPKVRDVEKIMPDHNEAATA